MNSEERHKRIVELRDKAARCRNLAAVNSDPQTNTTLKAYAVELEAEAATLEAAMRPQEPVLPPQALPSETANSPHTGEAVAALKPDVSAEAPAEAPAADAGTDAGA